MGFLMKQPVRLLSVFKDHQFRSINGSLRSCPDVLFVLFVVCLRWGSLPQVFRLPRGPVMPSPSASFLFSSLSPGTFPASLVPFPWCYYHLVSITLLLPLLVHDCHGRFVSYHEISVCIWKSHRIFDWSFSMMHIPF